MARIAGGRNRIMTRGPVSDSQALPAAGPVA